MLLRVFSRGLKGVRVVAAIPAVVVVVFATASSWFADASAARARSPLPSSSLVSVSCVASGWCAAVGNYTPIGREGSVTLAERRNGSGWAVHPSQNPKGALSSELSAVSCVSRRACVAVGDKVFGRHGCGGDVGPCPTRPIAELWNGESWKLELVPLLAPAATAAANPVLTAVSCSTRRFCVAVGGYAFGSGCATLGEGGPCEGRTIAERWNGKRWREMSTVGGVGALSGVSCSSSVGCTAVSFAADCLARSGGGSVCFGTGGPVAERWNGRGWSLEATPTVAGGGLSGVSCPSPRACMAVGTYPVVPSSMSLFAPLAEGWNGASWTVEPTPFDAEAGEDTLGAVSCSSPRACTAVGALENPGTTVVLRWDGTTWNVQNFPNPQNRLESVSCPSARRCVAVGFSYNPENLTGAATADAWNGARWRVERTA